MVNRRIDRSAGTDVSQHQYGLTFLAILTDAVCSGTATSVVSLTNRHNQTRGSFFGNLPFIRFLIAQVLKMFFSISIGPYVMTTYYLRKPHSLDAEFDVLCEDSSCVKYLLKHVFS